METVNQRNTSDSLSCFVNLFFQVYAPIYV